MFAASAALADVANEATSSLPRVLARRFGAHVDALAARTSEPAAAADARRHAAREGALAELEALRAAFAAGVASAAADAGDVARANEAADRDGASVAMLEAAARAAISPGGGDAPLLHDGAAPRSLTAGAEAEDADEALLRMLPTAPEGPRPPRAPPRPLRDARYAPAIDLALELDDELARARDDLDAIMAALAPRPSPRRNRGAARPAAKPATAPPSADSAQSPVAPQSEPPVARRSRQEVCAAAARGSQPRLARGAATPSPAGMRRSPIRNASSPTPTPRRAYAARRCAYAPPTRGGPADTHARNPMANRLLGLRRRACAPHSESKARGGEAGAVGRLLEQKAKIEQKGRPCQIRPAFDEITTRERIEQRLQRPSARSRARPSRV